MSLKPIGPKTRRKELAARVERALHDAGADAVLVGGSVVAIYSSERYVTEDLDFVSHASMKSLGAALAPLGFRTVGNRATHPETELYVQFCAPPLAVGREPVEPVTLKTRFGPIVTLSPTDCVLDRLMKLYHWDDEQGLEQALLVARRHEVDLRRVEEVSRREGKLSAFERFASRLREAGVSQRRRGK